MTDFTFVDATPVKSSPNRTSEPNPFLGIVTAINGKTIKDAAGKQVPAAKSFTVDTTDDNGKKELRRVLRLLGEAGLLLNPQVTVRRPYAQSDDGKTTTVTFWTVARINRPKSAKVNEPDTK